MAFHDDAEQLPKPGFLARYIFRTDYKTIGLQYLWLALASVFVGLLLSALLHVHGAQRTATVFPGFAATPEHYAALRLLHGSLMVFFVLVAAPQLGFGNYLLPLQVGADEMAFPTLNRFSFWMTAVSFVGMTASFFVSTALGIDLWLASAAIFSISALLSALNFAVTTIELRAEGMTLPRMPVTAWAWFLNAILSLLIFSVLLAGCAVILSDRLLGSRFFGSAALLAHSPQVLDPGGGRPALWETLFWYFAAAQVYVAMLPCFGIVTHVLATFSRRPVWKERLVVLAMGGVGVSGFCVWGYHMFRTGLDPLAPLPFVVLASSLGIPAAVLVAGWFGTICYARVELSTAMLFALGFVSLFLAGGLSGIFLANHDLARAAVTEGFLVGHFHLVMGVAATFALLAALFFWFPKLFGRPLDERLGKIHFWMTFAGVYCVFMPMHWLGLLEQSGRAAAGGGILTAIVTGATFWTIGAQFVFGYNFVSSLVSENRPNEANPWRAASLEWSAPIVPEAGIDRARPAVYRGAYESVATGVFIPQHLPPQLIRKMPS